MKASNLAMRKLRSIYEKAKKNSDFRNGRFVRKTIEEAEMNLAERLLELDEADITEDLLTTLEEEDIPSFEERSEIETKRIGFCA